MGMLVASELDVPVPVQSVQDIGQTNGGMKAILDDEVRVSPKSLTEAITTVLSTESMEEKNQKMSDVTSATEHESDLWDHTVVALEESSIFVWDREELHDILTSNGRIKAAASGAVSGDLRNKLKMDKRFNSLRTYSWMLEIVTYDNSIAAAEKATLEKFREQNHISQAEHERIIERAGWTMEEYERGLRHSESTMEMIRNWYLLNFTTRYTTD